MKKFAYKNYNGNEPFILLKACKDDKSYAYALGNKLVYNGVRVFMDVCGTRDSQDPEQTAKTIERCNLVIFLLSGKACDSLEMRNAVNYALEIKAKLICLKTDNAPLRHGMDMQLTNVTILPYDEMTVIDALRTYECLTQDVMGKGMELKNVNRTRQYILSSIAAVMVILLVVGGIFVKQRVDYHQSAEYVEYVFRNADDSDYINIAKYGKAGIAALANKSIKELDLTDGGFTSIDGISKVKIKSLILAGNPGLTDLHEIRDCDGLKRLVVSQDMLEAVKNCPHDKLEIVVAK